MKKINYFLVLLIITFLLTVQFLGNFPIAKAKVIASSSFNFDETEKFIFDENLLEINNNSVQLKPQINPWWNNDFQYRQEITINNPADNSVINYPILIELKSDFFDYEKADFSGSDIRFTSHDNQLLDYWIEHWNREGVSRVWVRLYNLEAGNSKKIYLYYGNDQAFSTADKAATFNNYYEDFSAGEIDWTNDWQTNYGNNDYSDFYRVDRLRGGYLIKDRQSYYSEEAYDYFDRYWNQVKKDYDQLGFWDSDNENWIRMLRWNEEEGWQNPTLHDWGYAIEMQEGSMMASMISGRHDMDDKLAKELYYIHNNLTRKGAIITYPFGVLDPIENNNNYAQVLSVLSLGAVYFKDNSVYQDLAEQSLADALKVFNYIKKYCPFPENGKPETPTNYFLRAYVNTWRAFDLWGEIYYREETKTMIDELIPLYQNCQNEEGAFDISNQHYPVQKQLKADIALMVLYQIDANSLYLEMVEDNLNWILENRLDQFRKNTGGLQWTTIDTENFYECHQLWFLTATKLFENNSGQDWSEVRADIFGFLTDDNFADVDMFVHNMNTYGPFFSYRAISRDGSIQKDDFHHFKGAYEIGTALWSLALNYDLYDSGHSWLITQAPEDVSDSWNKAIFNRHDFNQDKFSFQWDTKFSDISQPGAYVGLYNNQSSDWRISFDTYQGLNYLDQNDQVQVLWPVSELDSDKLYTLKLFKNNNIFRFVLVEEGNEILNTVVDDVKDFNHLYFGAMQFNALSFNPKNIRIDNLVMRDYNYPEPQVIYFSRIYNKYEVYSKEKPELILKPDCTFKYTYIYSFDNSVNEEANAGEVTYQLSPNNKDWYYYDGFWKVAQDKDQSNSMTEINNNLDSFSYIYPGGGYFSFKAIFHSNGSQPVVLENVNISYRLAVPESPQMKRPQVISPHKIKWPFIDNSIDERGFILNSGLKVGYLIGNNNSASFVEDGLKANTLYIRQIKAVNNAGKSINTGYQADYTLARIPGQPVISDIPNRIHLTIDKNLNPEGEGNSADTLYLVQEVNSNLYIQKDKKLGRNKVWLTYSQLGGDNGFFVNNLLSGREYGFRVKAKNFNGYETTYSDTTYHYYRKNIPEKSWLRFKVISF